MSFVVISTVKYPDALKSQVQTAGHAIVAMAKRQPGIVSITFSQARDTSQTLMHWEWNSEDHHNTFMNSEAWKTTMQQLAATFSAPGIEFSVATYDRLDLPS